MTVASSPSLRWRLVKRLVAFQTVMLALIVVIVVVAVWGTARFADAYEDSALDVLRDALVRNTDGSSSWGRPAISGGCAKKRPICGSSSATSKAGI